VDLYKPDHNDKPGPHSCGQTHVAGLLGRCYAGRTVLGPLGQNLLRLCACASVLSEFVLLVLDLGPSWGEVDSSQYLACSEIGQALGWSGSSPFLPGLGRWQAGPPGGSQCSSWATCGPGSWARSQGLNLSECPSYTFKGWGAIRSTGVRG
jgi:hypothetical protein